MINKNIFPRKRKIDFSDTQDIYITLHFSNFRKINNSFKSGRVTFYIFCHQDKLNIDSLGDRLDYLVSKVDELFNQSSYMGIGKLEFSSMDESEIDKNHPANIISYKVIDFN